MNIFKYLHCFLGLGVAFAVCNPALSQNAPVLGVQLSASVNITSTNAGLYAIQATSDLSNSNSWVCLDLVQLPAANLFWTDTSKSATSGQRFYRAVQSSTNFVYILPGTFTMGSPTNEALRDTSETQHLVTLSKGLYMNKYLVTQAEYLAVMGSNPSHATGSLNLPVDSVSWNDATNYCALRTAQEQSAGLIPTNWSYRLPTESEWEYACRAGTVTAFYLGSGLHSQQANFNGTNEYDSAVGNIFNSGGVSLQTTTVVGNYTPNPWGLYDMAGNLYEWCHDWNGAYPVGSVVDPQGPLTGVRHILRTASFSNPASWCRSAARISEAPDALHNFVGFRVVLARSN